MATNQDFSYRELVVQHFSACHWGHRIKTGNACMLSRFSRVRLFVIPWTVAHQAPLSMGFSRQEHWSGLSFPSPGDLPDPETRFAYLAPFTTREALLDTH